MIPLAAFLILTLPVPQDDLADRLKAKLKTLDARERKRVLDKLESLPEKQRREAAEEFLKKGAAPGFESCMARMAVKVLEGLNRRWSRLPGEEKQALTREAMAFYEALPPEVKQKILNLIQQEFLKSIRPAKKSNPR